MASHEHHTLQAASLELSEPNVSESPQPPNAEINLKEYSKLLFALAGKLDQGPSTEALQQEAMKAALVLGGLSERYVVVDRGISTGHESTENIAQNMFMLVGGIEELSASDESFEHETWLDTYVSLESLSFPQATGTEVWNDNDEPAPLTVEEVLATPYELSPFETLAEAALSDEVRNSLDLLQPKYAQALRMYYGLDSDHYSSCHEIAKALDISEYAAQQTLTGALRILRDRTAQRFEGYHYDVETSGPSPEYTPLKTERILARPKVVPHKRSLAQASKVELVNTFSGGRPERGSDTYHKIYDTFLGYLRECDLAEAFSISQKGSPYPKELTYRLNDQLGIQLTPEHIEDFWQHDLISFMIHLNRKMHGRFDRNRIGQLTSILLASRMDTADKIRLVIPTAHSIGHLGSWATAGTLILEGNPGDYTGDKMSGSAKINVIGSVGNFAGKNASGEAQLEVQGSAGRYLGQGAGGKSTITVLDGVGKYPGKGLREDATVKIYSGVIRAATAKDTRAINAK